jgi:hypothetical protein
VFHHAGADPGYKADFLFVPDAGVGAVLLTNADSGDMLMRPQLSQSRPRASDDQRPGRGDALRLRGLEQRHRIADRG